MFRPFVGEVLVGRIKQSDELGIRVRAEQSVWQLSPLPHTRNQSVLSCRHTLSPSTRQRAQITLGFFEDVFVPEHNLQQPAV